MISLRFPLSASLLLATLLLGACRDDSASRTEEETPAADTGSKTVLLPMQGERVPGYDSANAGVFRKIVYRQYAGLALQALPKKVVDSILKTTPMEKFESVMQSHMDRQAAAAREQLAAQYKITVDSVSSILEMGKAEKW